MTVMKKTGSERLDPSDAGLTGRRLRRQSRAQEPEEKPGSKRRVASFLLRLCARD